MMIRPLGQGGQGRVYEVRNALGRIVVLKQLPWVGQDNRERAQQEIRLLSSLRHPCIVPYIDSFSARSMPSLPEPDVVCLVMNRCCGDLRQECLRRREADNQVGERLAIHWFTQLCWGLHHLHARKFLHRDLKSQNVLLSEGEDPPRVLLADFGMAGHLEHSEDFKRTIVGTPSFMSPEMLEGRPYGCKTDQWALGCILYEIMALESPFNGCPSYAAIVQAVLHDPPLRAPGGYGLELSATLEALLARKPDERPSNAQLLGGPLLAETFRFLLKKSSEEVREAKAGGSQVPAASEEGSYASDFESYSGSDAEEVARRERQDGCVGISEWRQLHIEASALLQPAPRADPTEEAAKVRSALCRTLGSLAQVDRALDFLRERPPLRVDSDEEEEMVLQIEIVDLFGDEGLHALPLLERCLALEKLYGCAVIKTSASGTGD